MNVFVIPSWSPHRCWPLEGIFLREQALALGDLRPRWNVALSLWNQGGGRLSLDHFRRSPRCLRDAIAARPSSRELGPNVAEFTSPTFTWTESWWGGNRDGVLAANRRNLAQARGRFRHIDLLHAHVSYPAGWVAMKLSQETGIPFVVTEHMGPFPLPVYERADGSLEPYIREPLERAHALVAVSPALCARIAEFGLRRPEYVPNLVDERFCSPAPVERSERYTFFTLCQMELVKGIPDLLEAIRLFLARLPEAERSRVEWRLGGTGSQLGAFRALAGRLGLDPWVHWFGFMPRKDAQREYRACDAFVLASRHESFGIVLVEAAAFGKPVIATRSGGPETTVDHENGVLVEPGRPAELAEAMLSFYRGERAFDPERLRAKFLANYSRPAVIDKLEIVFEGARAAAAGAGRTTS